MDETSNAEYVTYFTLESLLTTYEVSIIFEAALGSIEKNNWIINISEQCVINFLCRWSSMNYVTFV
jgi:hypothetical protein